MTIVITVTAACGTNNGNRRDVVSEGLIAAVGHSAENPVSAFASKTGGNDGTKPC